MSYNHSKKTRLSNKENNSDIGNIYQKQNGSKIFSNYGNINGKRKALKSKDVNRRRVRDSLIGEKALRNKRRSKKGSLTRKSQILEEGRRRNRSKNLKTKRSKLYERSQNDVLSKNSSRVYEREAKLTENQYTQNFETIHVSEDYSADIIKTLIARDVSTAP